MDFKHILNRLKSAELWMNLLGYCAFIIGLLVIFIAGLNIYTHHGESIEVPNVKGLLYDSAETKLENAELNVLVVDSDYIKGLPAGTVLEQTPKPGAKVKEGRTIYLTLNSASAPTRALPDLADNSSVRQAQVKLRAMGFKLGPIEPIEGEKDWVYAIKFNGNKVFAGDRVPSDATLVLVVGTGMYGGENDSIQYSIDEIGDYSDALNDDDLNDE